ncbi:MAG: hypothetical protein ACRCTR_05895 [Actinomycetota bacterium]
MGPIVRARRSVIGVWHWFETHPAWVQILGIYLASRIVCAVAIEVAAVAAQNPAGVGTLTPHYPDMVTIWDGKWYRQIASDGYPPGVPIGVNLAVDYNAWAFFPVFPYLVRGVMAITGLPFAGAATTMNLIAGYGAALMLHRLVGLTAPPKLHRLATVAVAVWCLAPAAPILQVAYTEALAALLLGSALLLLLRERYLLAAPFVLTLGLTRAVAAPLLLVIGWHAVLRWRRRKSAPFTRWDATRLAVLAATTAASAVLWPVVVAAATGIPDAFLQTQARWGQQPTDGPFRLWIEWAWSGAGIAGVGALLGAVATLIHIVVGRHGVWLPVELRVWAIGYPLYLLAVTRPITSMWRFMLLDLPLAAVIGSLVVRGSWVRRLSKPARVWLLTSGCLIGLFWWTTILLTRLPWADNPP